MKISEAAKFFLDYHKANSKENSVRAYNLVLSRLLEEFGNEKLEEVSTERILSFLNQITEGKKPQTKRTRFSHLMAFFNFIKNNLDPDFRNPCDTPMLKKLFRIRRTYQFNIIEKETVDEIIFRTSKPRNRLMLELMARGGMRISEVLTIGSIRDADTYEVLRTLEGGADPEIFGGWMSWSDDGRYLLGTHEIAPRLWDVDAGVQIGDRFPHEPGIRYFGADGDQLQLVTATADHVLVWDLDVDTWPDLACRVAGRNMTRDEWAAFGPAGEPYRTTCPQYPPGV